MTRVCWFTEWDAKGRIIRRLYDDGPALPPAPPPPPAPRINRGAVAASTQGSLL